MALGEGMGMGMGARSLALTQQVFPVASAGCALLFVLLLIKGANSSFLVAAVHRKTEKSVF